MAESDNKFHNAAMASLMPSLAATRNPKRHAAKVPQNSGGSWAKSWVKEWFTLLLTQPAASFVAAARLIELQAKAKAMFDPTH